MTLPNFTQEEFINFLGDNGWKEISNHDWETHRRIMISNGANPVTFQLRKIYYFNHVVVLCNSLGISAPKDHQLCYDQLSELNRRKKEQEPGEE